MRGIEIWSVTEGQQRFDSHVDKLLNYLRYWQASGESIKTSERIKTRMGQLTEAGLYTGGPCPYGYQLVNKGRQNNRGHEIHDLEINPQEAVIIQKIFDYYIRYGYGSRKIASELTKQGILNRDSKQFHYSSITYMLHRKQLTGVLYRGESKSKMLPELQIITPDLFEKAQQITQMRRKGHIPRKVTGQALLSGNIYCGHCGGKMFATTARKSHHNNSSQPERIPIYKCYNRVQYPGRCLGPSTYRAQRIDKSVLEQVQMRYMERPQLKHLYYQFEQAEHPVRKMIISQWVARVVVSSYGSVEIEFREIVEPHTF